VPIKILHPKPNIQVGQAFMAFGHTNPNFGKVVGSLANQTTTTAAPIQGISVPSPKPNEWRLYFKGLTVTNSYTLTVSALSGRGRPATVTFTARASNPPSSVAFDFPLVAADAQQCSACVVAYGTWGSTGSDTGVLSATLNPIGGGGNLTDNDPFLDTGSFFWCASFYSVPDGDYNLSVQGNGGGGPTLSGANPLDIEAAYC
jgi:hypothetical protein